MNIYVGVVVWYMYYLYIDGTKYEGISVKFIYKMNGRSMQRTCKQLKVLKIFIWEKLAFAFSQLGPTGILTTKEENCDDIYWELNDRSILRGNILTDGIRLEFQKVSNIIHDYRSWAFFHFTDRHTQDFQLSYLFFVLF